MKKWTPEAFLIPKTNFKTRIILPTVAVLVILVVATNIFLSFKFLNFSDYLITSKLEAGKNNLRLHIEDSKKHSRAASSSMALDPDLIKAVKEGNRAELLRLLDPKLDLFQVTYFTVCNKDGLVLARTNEPDIFGDSVLDQQNFRDALKGEANTYFESGRTVKVSIRAGAPVRDRDGKIIGAISAGTRFDTDREVDSLKELFDAEVTVFLGNNRVATTITMSGKRIIDTALDPKVAKVVLEEKQEYDGDLEIYGIKYKVFYTPLINANDEAFAVFFLGLPKTDLIMASNDLIRYGIVIGIVGLLASITLMYFIISSISAPIITLSDDMDNVANGNLNVTLDIDGEDEIGRLSRSLKRVVDTVHKLIDSINDMIFEHNKGNTDYRIDTRLFNGSYKILADHILELANFSMRDQLTGILNRRSFSNRLRLEWGRAMREKLFISLLIIDVDKFKDYNDTHGHQQGDEALRSVAKALISSIKRSVDLAARWGGEEFVVLLPDTDSTGAFSVAEKIRLAVMDMPVRLPDGRLSNITVSIGVNSQIPGTSASVDDLITLADASLYHAKETGRNRVVVGEVKPHE